jgi:hypothetical protein
MSMLLPMLVSMSGLNEQDVLKIVRNAPVRYRTYPIPKRGGGERIISQPALELKILQRILATEFLSKYPVHVSAMAYRKNTSIYANAAAHAQNGPILKFDFADFFPSITAGDWRFFCSKNELFEDQTDLWISTNVFFQRQRSAFRLAIGAPSSPILSNVLMYDFDVRISRLVEEDYVTYTRYADDLTFSAKRTGYLTGVEKALRTTVREIKSPTLRINESKTVLATTKYKRVVTGLVLTNEGTVSIGQDKKREIRATIHHASLGRLSLKQRATLSGMLAFINDVEPAFLNRLIEKYGIDLINWIKSAPRHEKLD